MKPTYPEQIVINFLALNGFNFKIHDRSMLVNPKTKKHLELDIFIPNLNVGIEVQSKYHLWPKQRKRDLIKIELCKEKNIKLFHIFVPITKNKLNNLLNKILNKKI